MLYRFSVDLVTIYKKINQHIFTFFMNSVSFSFLIRFISSVNCSPWQHCPKILQISRLSFCDIFLTHAQRFQARQKVGEFFIHTLSQWGLRCKSVSMLRLQQVPGALALLCKVRMSTYCKGWTIVKPEVCLQESRQRNWLLPMSRALYFLPLGVISLKGCMIKNIKVTKACVCFFRQTLGCKPKPASATTLISSVGFYGRAFSLMYGVFKPVLLWPSIVSSVSLHSQPACVALFFCSLSFASSEIRLLISRHTEKGCCLPCNTKVLRGPNQHPLIIFCWPLPSGLAVFCSACLEWNMRIFFGV